MAGLLAAGLGCVLDEMDATGKACDQAHPCPAGTTCLVTAGHGVCVADPGDGGADGADADGDVDGTDGADSGDGGPTCSPEATRCTPEADAVERCDAEGTGWLEVPCLGGYYCLAPPAGAAACVAPCATSPDCPGGMYCDPARSRCELKGSCSPPGEVRCDNTFSRLVRCDAESLWEVLVEDCAAGGGYCDPWAVACKPYCDLDEDCEAWPTSSCDPVARRCAETGVCFEPADCPEALVCRVEGPADSPGLCLRTPETEATNSSDPPQPSDMACYVLDPTPPGATPATCDVEGAVVEYYSRAGTADTIGLVVRAHRQVDVLNGDRSQFLQQVTADTGADQKGHYRLTGLPTNTELVLEVQGRAPVPPDVAGFASLLTFGVYLNADACAAAQGTLSLSAPAIYQEFYDGYADPAGLGEADAGKGVVLAQARDCDGLRVWHAVGGLSAPHGRFFYLQPAPAAPDVDLTETTQNGWFGASNVSPVRGLVGAWALSGGAPISFWTRPVRAFPGAASLVLLEEPDHPRSP